MNFALSESEFRLQNRRLVPEICMETKLFLLDRFYFQHGHQILIEASKNFFSMQNTKNGTINAT